MVKKTKSEHYVSNKDFLEAMKKFKKKCNKAQREKQPLPPVDNYIGECFLKIANHLSYRPNFINYTYRDDMISDGIENCLQYVHNFNPAKSNNPFAYFTQIIYYAFIRRIQKEKKQTTIKTKIIMDNNLDDMSLIPGQEDEKFKNVYREFLQKNIPLMEENKPKVVRLDTTKKKKTIKKKTSLEYFL